MKIHGLTIQEHYDVSFSGLMEKYSQPMIQRVVAHIALI
jgi:hypothetical protein